MSLIKNIESFGTSSSIKKSDISDFNKISKAMKQLINSDEVLFETNDFAIIGNVSDRHLYQASQTDIIGSELICLAQVKKVYKEGTELMKNSTLSKFKDKKLKEGFVNALNDILNNDSYDFSSTVKASIEGKPVYEVEIIALFQTQS